jgi:hypothetical protein
MVFDKFAKTRKLWSVEGVRARLPLPPLRENQRRQRAFSAGIRCIYAVENKVNLLRRSITLPDGSGQKSMPGSNPSMIMRYLYTVQSLLNLKVPSVRFFISSILVIFMQKSLYG